MPLMPPSPDKKPNYLLRGIVCLLIAFALIVAHFVIHEKSETPPALTETVIVPEEKTQSPPPIENSDSKFYTVGQYKVGRDFPAGQYLAIGKGYLELSKTPNADVSKGEIIFNDNFDGQCYIDAQEGEYIKIMGELKLYPADSAPKISPGNGVVPQGQFKVGTDIPAGEYKITTTNNGYFEIKTGTRRDTGKIIKNQFSLKAGSFYATVDNGQYLTLKNATAEIVR